MKRTSLSFLDLDGCDILDRDQMKSIAGGDGVDGCNMVNDTTNDQCYHVHLNQIWIGADASTQCFAECAKQNCCSTCDCD